MIKVHEPSAELANVIGHLQFDGLFRWARTTWEARYSNTNLELINEFVCKCANVLKRFPHVRINKKTKNGIEFNASVYGMDLEFLKEYCISNWFVPLWVPNNQKCYTEYLRAFFDDEGGLS